MITTAVLGIAWPVLGAAGCGHHAASAVAPAASAQGYPAPSAQPISATSAPAAPAPAVPAPASAPAPPSVAPAAAPRSGAPTAGAQTATASARPPAPANRPAPSSPASGPPRAYEPPMPPAPPDRSAPPPAPKSTGRRFVVHGVAPSDVLNMRAGPSSNDEVVGTIPPGASGVVAIGPRRQEGPSIWREVSYGGVRGWVNARFLLEERAPPRSH